MGGWRVVENCRQVPSTPGKSPQSEGAGWFCRTKDLKFTQGKSTFQGCVTSTSTNNLSGTTLPVIVAVTETTSPAGVGSEKVTVVVPAPLETPSSWKACRSVDQR